MGYGYGVAHTPKDEMEFWSQCKVNSKDEDASQRSKDDRCSTVMHSLCFELNVPVKQF